MHIEHEESSKGSKIEHEISTKGSDKFKTMHFSWQHLMSQFRTKKLTVKYKIALHLHNVKWY
jgi:hypothetical protein